MCLLTCAVHCCCSCCGEALLTCIAVCSQRTACCWQTCTLPHSRGEHCHRLFRSLHLHCHPNLSLQLYDIEIDRINKPYLPLAAGDFSVPTGWALVVATGAASLAIGAGEGCGKAGRWCIALPVTA